jgi:diguanylate cyclase (GGDEF)-like protein
MNSTKSCRRFTLVQKLIASYAALAFFSLAAIIFSTAGLYSLNRIVQEIASNDFAFINSADKLRESLNAQEKYIAKYAILKSPVFADLFQHREAEFLSILKEMAKKPSGKNILPISTSYQSFQKGAKLLFQGKNEDFDTFSKEPDRVRASIENFYVRQQKSLTATLRKAEQKQKWTIQWSLLISFSGFLLAVCVMALLIYTISTSINKLKRATFRIAEGDFDYDPQLPPGDEIGDLARDFTSMAAKLKVLEQLCLDASPLTRLPGNIAIERILNKKLQEPEPFAVCYADLDNFKTYNDRYGYIKGSEVIKMTGEIIYDAVTEHSSAESFVGHVGGDDFVMVVPTEDVSNICEAVIKVFTERISEHYSAEDLAKGFTEGKDRYGVKRIFPIMTISIAVLTCQKGEYDSAVKIARAAVEIKEYAKETTGSNYLINRRGKER